MGLLILQHLAQQHLAHPARERGRIAGCNLLVPQPWRELAGLLRERLGEAARP
jgi:hypothetical protein